MEQGKLACQHRLNFQLMEMKIPHQPTPFQTKNEERQAKPTEIPAIYPQRRPHY